MADANLPRSDFYVYVMFRHDTGEPFYVGKGRGTRYIQTQSDKHNYHKMGILKAARLLGRDTPIVKVAVDLLEN